MEASYNPFVRVVCWARRTTIHPIQNVSSPNLLRSYRLIFLVLFLFAVGSIYLVGFFFKKGNLLHFHKGTVSIGSNQSVKVDSAPACPIPQLDPYNPFIQHFLQEKPPSVKCENEYPLLFNSTLQSTIIPAKGKDYFKQSGIKSCHYRTVARYMGSYKPDEHIITSNDVYPLSLKNATIIPPEHEFIAIYCKFHPSNGERLMDVHAFVPLKPAKQETKNDPDPDTRKRKRKWNVLVFGMDAVSRMNFLRTFPNTYAYLMNQLGAVEMLGYNKVGANTFPNIIPMLTSKKPSELSCTSDYFNDCPFIWKEYSKEGYSTAFAEDDPVIGIFNFQMAGFKDQPTDYYLRAMVQFAEYQVKSHHQFNGYLCYGPRLTFQVLLNYMEKFVHAMRANKKPFFQFTWATALTHDYLAAGHLGDPHLLRSLKWMKESGHLDDTIFILMSDHGNRMAPILGSSQGALEDRLPPMYLVLPDACKKQYGMAYNNLRQNSDKLVTLFDLQETLKDILHPESIEDSALAKMEMVLHLDEFLPLITPRGISLFRQIPEDRTCAMAGIEDFFCSCNYLSQVSTDEPELKVVAATTVKQIDLILANSTRSSPCAKLQLEKILFAQRAEKSDHYKEGYLISFTTMPGGGQFEALVVRKTKDHPWRVQGPVARTNIYATQSQCVSDVKLKPYCYCSGSVS